MSGMQGAMVGNTMGQTISNHVMNGQPIPFQQPEQGPNKKAVHVKVSWLSRLPVI